MKKHDIFTFTAPNGVEVTAVVLERIFQGSCKSTFICYAQNRIFTYIEELFMKFEGTAEWKKDYSYGEVLVDYAILPDYDELLKVHESLDYPLWEQNLEAEIQGMNDR